MIVTVEGPELLTEAILAPEMVKRIEIMLPGALRKIEAIEQAAQEGLAAPYKGQDKAYLN